MRRRVSGYEDDRRPLLLEIAISQASTHDALSATAIDISRSIAVAGHTPAQGPLFEPRHMRISARPILALAPRTQASETAGTRPGLESRRLGL
ncbi:hypothetical protein [Salinisphaera aquimarina]|uniref:Uncharacterized protein n=1 Tax=Salinisphaera aquimarina TaxID=2094031 RepID=A0ABV7ER27_9GAMM